MSSLSEGGMRGSEGRLASSTQVTLANLEVPAKPLDRKAHTVFRHR